MTILFGQCDEATQTKIVLGDNYTEDRNEGRLLAFIQRLRAICFYGNDGGLTFPPSKQVVAIKSLNTYKLHCDAMIPTYFRVNPVFPSFEIIFKIINFIARAKVKKN